MTDDPLKSVNSLLLTAELPSDAWERFRPRVVEILDKSTCSPEPPELRERRRPDAVTACCVDLLDDLRADLPYDVALEFLLGAYEPVMLELLSADPEVTWNLSALLAVDESLAAFTVAIPRIPASLNNLSNFQFEYFVWHNSVGKSEADDETQNSEGNPCQPFDA